VEHQPVEVRAAILEAIARYEAGDDSVRRTFVGGPPLGGALGARLASYPAWGAAGTFSTNHDQTRLGTELPSREALRLAAALVLTAPGTPWLYYGEEIGMANGTGVGGDEAKRRPMQWSAAANAGFTSGVPWVAPASATAEDTVEGQRADPNSLFQLHKALIALKKQVPALSTGSGRVVTAVGSSSEPLALWRTEGTSSVVLVYNFGESRSEVRVRGVTEGLRFVDRAALRAPITRASVSDDLVVQLSARGFAILEAN